MCVRVCVCVCVFVSVVSLCVWLLPQEPLTEQSCQETNDLRQTCGPWLRALTGLYLGYMTKKKKKKTFSCLTGIVSNWRWIINAARCSEGAQHTGGRGWCVETDLYRFPFTMEMNHLGGRVAVFLPFFPSICKHTHTHLEWQPGETLSYFQSHCGSKSSQQHLFAGSFPASFGSSVLFNTTRNPPPSMQSALSCSVMRLALLDCLYKTAGQSVHSVKPSTFSGTDLNTVLIFNPESSRDF